MGRIPKQKFIYPQNYLQFDILVICLFNEYEISKKSHNDITILRIPT